MNLRLAQALERAKNLRRTAHFDIRYALREPVPGSPTQSYGVHSEALIDAYAQGLEAAWTDLQKLGMPVTSAGIAPPGFIRCLVTDLNDVFPTKPIPMCSAELEGDEIHPIIVLPTDFPELVDLASVLAMARFTARHEPAHAWAYRVWRERWAGLPVLEASRSIRYLATPPVLWLLEGHAVAVEAGDECGGPWLQHAWSWCERPEVSLFTEPYSAGLFARYLDRRLGLAAGEAFSRIISAITLPPHSRDSAFNAVWQTMNQVLAPFQLTAEMAWLDACRAGAFIGGSKHPADEEAAVFARYGRRAVTASLSLRAGEVQTTSEYAHAALSCRYFRLTLEAGVKTLHLLVERLRWRRGFPQVHVGLWSADDSSMGTWLEAGQTSWSLPASMTLRHDSSHWILICALTPDASGRAYETTPLQPWSLQIETA